MQVFCGLTHLARAVLHGAVQRDVRQPGAPKVARLSKRPHVWRAWCGSSVRRQPRLRDGLSHAPAAASESLHAGYALASACLKSASSNARRKAPVHTRRAIEDRSSGCGASTCC